MTHSRARAHTLPTAAAEVNDTRTCVRSSPSPPHPTTAVPTLIRASTADDDGARVAADRPTVSPYTYIYTRTHIYVYIMPMRYLPLTAYIYIRTNDVSVEELQLGKE